ncbi:hypothetical protein GY45DRAFT_626850 [Cubamyces sp. BRFM 1775]|nr:hypothetical protein GY45DRAFT_626850 [Cubamyces sp. BRFM 1775]
MILNSSAAAEHNLNLYAVSTPDDSPSFPLGAIIGLVGGLIGVAILLAICKFARSSNAASGSRPTYYHTRTHSHHHLYHLLICHPICYLRPLRLLRIHPANPMMKLYAATALYSPQWRRTTLQLLANPTTESALSCCM